MKKIDYIYIIKEKATNEIVSSFGSKSVFSNIGHIKTSMKMRINSPFDKYIVVKYKLQLDEVIEMKDLI